MVETARDTMREPACFAARTTLFIAKLHARTILFFAEAARACVIIILICENLPVFRKSKTERENHLVFRRSCENHPVFRKNCTREPTCFSPKRTNKYLLARTILFFGKLHAINARTKLFFAKAARENHLVFDKSCTHKIFNMREPTCFSRRRCIVDAVHDKARTSLFFAAAVRVPTVRDSMREPPCFSRDLRV
jgi:hypothetical protein